MKFQRDSPGQRLGVKIFMIKLPSRIYYRSPKRHQEVLVLCCYCWWSVFLGQTSIIFSFPHMWRHRAEITRSSKLVSITMHRRIVQNCILWKPTPISLDMKDLSMEPLI